MSGRRAHWLSVLACAAAYGSAACAAPPATRTSGPASDGAGGAAAAAPGPVRMVVPPHPTDAQGRLILPQTLAVIVGCGQYQSPALPDLRGPAEDARALAGWLARPGATDHELRVLIDAEATRERILDAIADFLAARARMDDLVVFVFAGTATADAAGAPVLCAHDTDPDRAAETGLPLGDLAARLAAIPHADILVVLDAGAGEAAVARFAGPGRADPAAVAAALAPLLARPFTAVVTAAEPGEGAGGALGTVAGLFTWHWCRAAAQVPDPDGDGWIEAREIYARACAAVQQDAFLDHRAQSPDWRASEGTETFLVPKRAGG